MNKQETIDFIKQQINSGVISQTDLQSLNPTDTTDVTNEMAIHTEDNSKKMTNIFYGIGAIIAVIGVAILVGQNWDEIGFIGRIATTLGIAIATYIGGLLLKTPEQKNISQIFFIIATVLSPLGSYVLLKEAGIDFSWSSQLVTAISLLIIFGVALYISKRNILSLVTIAFASWAYYTIIIRTLELNNYSGGDDLLKWATILLGISYIAIAYGYKSHALQTQTIESDEKKEIKAIKNVVYGFGTLAILGAGISIGGIFDIVLIALIFGTFYGSVYIKSRTMLIIGALFLVAHIIKLTSKYFVDSIGWSVALIVVGFLVIGVGYLTLRLNKKIKLTA